MKSLGMVTALILVCFLSAVWSGIVFSELWGWFVVPVFQVERLGLPDSIGLMLFAQYVTHQWVKPDEGRQAIISQVSHLALKPAMALLFGWIVKGFI